MRPRVGRLSHGVTGLFLAMLLLVGCSGGGGTTPAVSNNNTSTGTNGATIGNISSLLAAVSTTPVKLEGSAAPPEVDPGEASSLTSSGVSPSDIAAVAGITSVKTHVLKSGASAFVAAVAKRQAQDNAFNSPFDISYFGGYVLGGAQSNDLFVNCVQSCRNAGNVHPGTFLHDLFHDYYLGLVEEYLSSPGELVVPGGKFEVGRSVNVPFTYDPIPPGFTNPVITDTEILDIVQAGADLAGTGNPNLVHIYNVILPPNVDTCIIGASSTQCWSPDNPSDFYFCGYHGAAVYPSGNVALFTVIPWSSLQYCSASSQVLNFPNQVAAGNDPADAIYGVLSHETFETITDPIPGGGWFNYSLGDEIGDLCAGYQNFVTLNGDHYYIQSEYSDIGQECISANLTYGQQQTP